MDRNDLVGQMEHKRGPSLSARRAWIEIIVFAGGRKVRGCRSPQGERG